MRPLVPIDETRYVSVAWEMWNNHNFLVPHLNGQPYSHKPPLLFWLINAGWKIFGVVEWWPRLLPPLFGLGCLFLTLRLAHILWPRDHDISFAAPLILLGSGLWLLFTTVVTFDTMVVFFVLLYFVFMWRAFRFGNITGWLYAGVALGLGILSKGPVVLLPVLSAASLVPWWKGEKKLKSPLRWYAGILLSVLVGAGISLLWAIPAARAGGEEYAAAILWGQTAGRIASSFAHQKPWWWYMPLLPLILLPWTMMPSLWRGFRSFDMRDTGTRFCLSWIIPPLIVFSLISGKQIYYMLPLFPAFSLLFARAFTYSELRRTDFFPQIALMVLLGVILLVIPLLHDQSELPVWIRTISPFVGIVMLLCSVGVSLMFTRKVRQGILVLSGAGVLILMVILTGVFSKARPFYDVRPISEHLKQLEQKGYPIAHMGTYYDQFHFPGRLKSINVVFNEDQLDAWLTEHQEGRAVLYFSKWPTPLNPHLSVEYIRPYMGKYAAVVTRRKDGAGNAHISK